MAQDADYRYKPTPAARRPASTNTATATTPTPTPTTHHKTPHNPGIYIHIPFCVSKCAYCNFYSIPSLKRVDEYIATLLFEMELCSNRWSEKTFGSIYFGGGTPSVLPVDSIPGLLDALRQYYALADDCEISCEANPDSFTAEHALAWHEAGVNRLSLGLQSSDESMLRNLGRRHSAEQFLTAVNAAQNAGIGNINGDMMFGIPGQSITMLDDTISLLVGASVQHISCYGLQLEEGTPLHTLAQSGKLMLPDEDETGAMYEHIKSALPSLGFGRYEISNYAKPAHQCRHNLNYWANGEYLALGAAASGALRIKMQEDAVFKATYQLDSETEAPFATGKNIPNISNTNQPGPIQQHKTMHRYTNPADIDEYIANITSGMLPHMQPISRDEEMFESVMLATRTTFGLDLVDFEQRYGVDFLRRYKKAAGKCIEAGLAVVENGCFRLSDRGLDMQNSVLMDFMD